MDTKKAIEHLKKLKQQYELTGDVTEACDMAIAVLEKSCDWEWNPFYTYNDGVAAGYYPYVDESEDILVSDGYSVWLDTIMMEVNYCGTDEYWLDSGNDTDGLYWMYLPEPPKIRNTASTADRC